MSLDIKTIFTLFALGNVFTVVFFAAYIFLYGIRKKKLDIYIFGKIFQTITWVLYIFRDVFSSQTAIIASNTFLYFGLTFEIYAIIIANQQFNKRKFIIINAIAILYIFISAYFSNSVESVRVAIASIFVASIIFYGGIELLRGNSNFKMQRLTGTLAMLMGLTFVARAINASFFDPNAALYANNLVQVFTYVSLFLVAYSYPIIFLFLMKEQDEITMLENKQQIENDNQALKKLNATKDKLFSIIAHDLRSPYSAILGFAELMESKEEKASEKEIAFFTQLITKSTRQSFNLLNNLLQWSRVQTGLIHIKLEMVDLNEMIEDITRLLQTNLVSKNIQLHTKIPKNFNLMVDRMMLDTILRNLISNSIKFTNPKGTITVSVTRCEEYSEFQVTDTGIGISQENIDKLFSIQSNYTQLGTRREKGTGLGLILCKEFINCHKGKIWIESTIGVGTSIYFSIPHPNKPIT